VGGCEAAVVAGPQDEASVRDLDLVGGKGCKAYDTTEKTWRHLNFFQHETYLHVRTPRVHGERCGVKLVDVPWGRHGSNYVSLFVGTGGRAQAGAGARAVSQPSPRPPTPGDDNVSRKSPALDRWCLDPGIRRQRGKVPGR
jgi:hypothetical protein